MKKHLILFCLIVLFLSKSLAQNTTNNSRPPNITPTNPTAQEFEKFLGYPVSPATGLIDLSIPLYELQLPGLSIPISLKYHSSGIKVEQSYGNLGYGWTMFPQFKITRTIRGKADDRFITGNPPNSGNFSDLVEYSTPAGSLLLADNSTKDGDYDIFSISLPKYNGNFIIRRDANNAFQFQSITGDPLQVVFYTNQTAGSTAIPSSISGFEVTDTDGVKYLFGNASGLVSFGTSEYHEFVNSEIASWLLSKITLPGTTDNSLIFHYGYTAENKIDLLPKTMTITDKHQTFDVPACDAFVELPQAIIARQVNAFKTIMGINDGTTQGTLETRFFRLNYLNSSYSYLPRAVTSISFPGGKINFNYSPYVGGSGLNQLQSMKVYNNNQTVVHAVDFVQNTDHLLQKVIVNGKEYTMEYNPYRFQSEYGQIQQCQRIYAQDRWGYFNNQPNVLPIPRIKLGLFGSHGFPLQDEYFGYAANREPDAEAMKACILEKITYPTKGWSRFYYEPNQFLRDNLVAIGGGLRIKQMDSYDPVAANTLTKTYKYGENESGIGNLIEYPDDNSFISEEFIVGKIPFYCLHDPIQHIYSGGGRITTISNNSRSRYNNLGLPIWYNKVNEYSEGGKTAYEYTYNPDGSWYYSYSAGILEFQTEYPINQTSLFRNLITDGGPSLIKKQIYKGESGSYSILEETQNNYIKYDPALPVSGAVIYPILRYNNVANPVFSNYDWISGGGGYALVGSVNPFFYAPYTILFGKINLVSTIKKEYVSNTSVPITTTTTFDYDGNYPFNMISSQVTQSDASVIKKNFYYPTSSTIPDLSAPQQTMVSVLKNNNRLTSLIQTTTFKDTAPLSGELISYKNWSTNVFKPEQVFIKKNNDSYESRLHFYDYNPQGNVREVAQETAVITPFTSGVTTKANPLLRLKMLPTVKYSPTKPICKPYLMAPMKMLL